MEEGVGFSAEEMGEGRVGDGGGSRGTGAEEDQDAGVKIDSQSQEGLVQVEQFRESSQTEGWNFESEEGILDGGESESISEDCESQRCKVKSQEGCREFDFQSEENAPRSDDGNVVCGECYSTSEDFKSEDREDKSQEDCRGFVKGCFTQYNHDGRGGVCG